MEAAAHSLNKLSLARTQWDVNYSLQYVANCLEVKNGKRNEEILDLILDLREGFHVLFLEKINDDNANQTDRYHV